MRYWKVYAQCIRKPVGTYVSEISKDKAYELIVNSVVETVGECDMTKAIDFFETYDIFECGDFAVIRSEKFPFNSAIYGFTAKEIYKICKGENYG